MLSAAPAQPVSPRRARDDGEEEELARALAASKNGDSAPNVTKRNHSPASTGPAAHGDPEQDTPRRAGDREEYEALARALAASKNGGGASSIPKRSHSPASTGPAATNPEQKPIVVDLLEQSMDMCMTTAEEYRQARAQAEKLAKEQAASLALRTEQIMLLKTMGFSHKEDETLADVLEQNNNNLEQSLDQLLAMQVEEEGDASSSSSDDDAGSADARRQHAKMERKITREMVAFFEQHKEDRSMVTLRMVKTALAPKFADWDWDGVLAEHKAHIKAEAWRLAMEPEPAPTHEDGDRGREKPPAAPEPCNPTPAPAPGLDVEERLHAGSKRVVVDGDAEEERTSAKRQNRDQRAEETEDQNTEDRVEMLQVGASGEAQLPPPAIDLT